MDKLDFTPIENKLKILNQAFKNQEGSKQYIYGQIIRDLVAIFKEKGVPNGNNFIEGHEEFDKLFEDFQTKGIYGLLTKNEAKALFAISKQSKQIVEIGTFIGMSSSLMAQNAEKIYCIDCGFQDKMHHNDYVPFHIFYKSTEQTDRIPNHVPKLVICQENWEKAQVKDKIITVCKYSDDAIQDVPDEVCTLWVDGSHEFISARNDMFNYFPKVKNGGIIAIHDYNTNASSSSVVGATYEFYQEFKDQLSEPYITDSLIWFRKTSDE